MFWDKLVSFLTMIGLPLIYAYHLICSNIFLNVSVADAQGFEKAGNVLLTPVQYLLAGKEAISTEEGEWVLKQRFDYQSSFWPKSIASVIALPISLVFGSTLKGIGYCLSEDARKKYHSLTEHSFATTTRSNLSAYLAMGLKISADADFLAPQGYERRPGDKNHMGKAKEGLKEIAKLLTTAGIPWWVDCGTLLGTYRYGGIIPWDYDIDIAVLMPDFENVRRALNQLDPKKYLVQDWSSRTYPDSFFKVLVKETKDFIDLYFYEIDPQRQELRYIFSLEENIFFPEWWKKDERRFKKPVAFDNVFPLKKGTFDGVEVFIPNRPVPFLQRYYGENLSPAKIYNSETGSFEKDLNHPYWKNAYVH